MSEVEKSAEDSAIAASETDPSGIGPVGGSSNNPDWLEEPTPLGVAWGGIVLAGGFYPCLVLFILGGWGALMYGFPNTDELLGFLLLAPVLLMVAGCIYASLGTIPAFALLQLFRFCTAWNVTERASCGIFGGLTAFVCSYPLRMLPPGEADLTWLAMSFLLPIVLGHLGGIWGCFHRRYEKDWFHDSFLAADRRITLKLLMGITMLVAIFVAGCKAFGEEGLRFACFAVAYAVLQTVMLFVESLWRRRVGGL